MKKITQKTSLLEMSAIVSEALENADIPAILGGGGAVTHYSENEYMSTDLDFITVVSNKIISPVVAELGFQPEGKNFYHPASEFYLEFPPGPLSFGDKYIDPGQTTVLETEFGKVRIITATQCVMDRIAWLYHGNDLQAKEQAVMVAARNDVDWQEIRAWSRKEGMPADLVKSIRAEADEG